MSAHCNTCLWLFKWFIFIDCFCLVARQKIMMVVWIRLPLWSAIAKEIVATMLFERLVMESVTRKWVVKWAKSGHSSLRTVGSCVDKFSCWAVWLVSDGHWPDSRPRWSGGRRITYSTLGYQSPISIVHCQIETSECTQVFIDIIAYLCQVTFHAKILSWLDIEVNCQSTHWY